MSQQQQQQQQQQNNKQEVFNWDEATIAMLQKEYEKYEKYNSYSTPSNQPLTPGNEINPEKLDMQMQLNEPLFECKIGWYYDPNRTTTKRNNQPLRKKPSYRYARSSDYLLGRLQEGLSNLDYVLNSKSLRNCVVFIPNELWSRYPNEQSWYSPEPTSYVNVNVNDITLPPSTSLVVNEPKQTLFSKLINWFKN